MNCEVRIQTHNFYFWWHIKICDKHKIREEKYKQKGEKTQRILEWFDVKHLNSPL